MSVMDMGEIPITECDDANIPVVCFLHPPGDDEGFQDKWTWTASNFMPRKEVVGRGYKLVADTKEEILELIHKHVAPLYAIALSEIWTGTLYYWHHRDPPISLLGRPERPIMETGCDRPLTNEVKQ